MQLERIRFCAAAHLDEHRSLKQSPVVLLLFLLLLLFFFCCFSLLIYSFVHLFCVSTFRLDDDRHVHVPDADAADRIPPGMVETKTSRKQKKKISHRANKMKITKTQRWQ